MLNIYPVLLDLIRCLRVRLQDLERHDYDLARQCRRALSSVALNLAEGAYSRGQNRGARYHTALGSLREVLACFEVAEALGYSRALEPELLGRFNHVIGTLVRLSRGSGR
jgi:four helix bundle protein